MNGLIMEQQTQPICYIIAGPNGAGKTTFALKFLPALANCRNFVNADMIAAGLAPLAPESMQTPAARMFLSEVQRFVQRRESFGFETTLAGRTYLRLIRQLQAQGWRVELYYLWLPNTAFSAGRVRERVAHGGHNIPYEDIQRRFPKSIANLLNDYAALCDWCVCLDNSTTEPELIFLQEGMSRRIVHAVKFEQLIRSAKA